jgi:hypothetical protein
LFITTLDSDLFRNKILSSVKKIISFKCMSLYDMISSSIINYNYCDNEQEKITSLIL